MYVLFLVLRPIIILWPHTRYWYYIILQFKYNKPSLQLYTTELVSTLDLNNTNNSIIKCDMLLIRDISKITNSKMDSPRRQNPNPKPKTLHFEVSIH